MGWIGEGDSSAATPAELISVAPGAGTPLGSDDSEPSVSGDGNIVVFTAHAPAGQEFWYDGVAVRNRSAGTTNLIGDLFPQLQEAHGGVVSRDGCHVVFWGWAGEVTITFPGLPPFIPPITIVISPAQWDIYSWNRCAAAGNGLAVASTAADFPLLTANGDQQGALAVSADGRFVSYIATSAGATPRIGRIDTSTSTEVLMPNTAVISANSIDISDDGAFVAVGIRANIQPLLRDVVVGWNPACIPTKAVICTSVSYVSVSAPGRPAGGDSSNPSVSADGRYVAFSSNAADIVGLPGTPTTQVYVRDRTAGVSKLITDTPGAAMDGRVEEPEISPDGSQIALQRRASDGAAVAGDIAEVYVARSASGYFNTAVFDLVSYGINDQPTSLDSVKPSMSSNGREVAFASFATVELSGLDLQNDQEVWLRERPIALDITPTIDFGTVDVGGQSAPKTAVITNTSNVAINIGSVTPPVAPFSVNGNGCLGALQPGATCNVTLVFSPTAPGGASSTLTVAGDGLSVSAALVGIGRAPNVPVPGSLKITPASADYGSAAVGSSVASRKFVVSNPGQTAVTLAGVGLSGAGADQFTAASNTNFCTAGLSLAGGASCSIEVGATLTRSGAMSATLGAVGSGGQSAQATLRISGTVQLFTPTLKMNPGVVSAGEVTAAMGEGFPPNIDVELAFEGEVPFATVSTDGDGAFRLEYLLLRNGARIGGRQVVVVDQAQFSGVRAPLLIDLATYRPSGFSSPAITSGVRSMFSRGG